VSETAVTSELGRFCADQYYSFDERAWLARAAADGARVAAVAEYLSATSWFGYEDELASIAAAIRAKAGVQPHRGNLDLGRLSALTRYLVAERRKPVR
jgi:hypothetical protein